MPPVCYCVMCGCRFFGSDLRCEQCRAIIAERMQQEALEDRMRSAAPDLYAALEASTELLREYNEIDWAEDKEITQQIAANEAALRKARKGNG